MCYRQRTDSARSVCHPNHLEQEPGNRALCYESGIGRGRFHLRPDGACVQGILPSGTNLAIGHYRRINVRLKRVGAEEVGGELFTFVIKKRRLRREEYEAEAVACGPAYVVLRADGVTFKERLELR